MNDDYLLNKEYYGLDFEIVTEIVKSTFIHDETKIMRSDHNNYVYLRLENKVNEPLSILRLKKVKINEEDYYEANKSLSFVKKKDTLNVRV